MNKNELTKRIDEIGNDLESILVDDSIQTVVKSIKTLKDKIDNLAQEIEDESDESE